MYFIKISGFIAEEKVNEFTVTADSCFGRWKHLCTDVVFSKDLIHSDLCHYLSTWENEKCYKDFIHILFNSGRAGQKLKNDIR